MSKLIRIAIGVLLFMLGLAGFVLPGLPGWFFVLLGLVALSAEVPAFARAVCWIERRFPVTKQVLKRIRQTFHGNKAPFPPCNSEDR